MARKSTKECPGCHGTLRHNATVPEQQRCPAWSAEHNAVLLRNTRQRYAESKAYREVRAHIGEVSEFLWSVIDGEPIPLPEWLETYV